MSFGAQPGPTPAGIERVYGATAICIALWCQMQVGDDLVFGLTDQHTHFTATLLGAQRASGLWSGFVTRQSDELRDEQLPGYG